MYHKLILVGNLDRDPERGATETGKPVTNFSVTTVERWPGAGGQVHRRIVRWRVTAFGALGKVCHEQLKAGQAVLVEGVLHADPHTGTPPLWLGRDGRPRTSFEVRAQVVKFVNRPQPENAQPVASDLPKGDVRF